MLVSTPVAGYRREAEPRVGRVLRRARASQIQAQAEAVARGLHAMRPSQAEPIRRRDLGPALLCAEIGPRASQAETLQRPQRRRPAGEIRAGARHVSGRIGDNAPP